MDRLRQLVHERKPVERPDISCFECGGEIFIDRTGSAPEVVCLDCPVIVPPAFLNVKQAARRLFCSPSQVRRLVRLGRLPAERHGRDIRIPVSAIPAAA